MWNEVERAITFKISDRIIIHKRVLVTGIIIFVELQLLPPPPLPPLPHPPQSLPAGFHLVYRVITSRERLCLPSLAPPLSRMLPQARLRPSPTRSPPSSSTPTYTCRSTAGPSPTRSPPLPPPVSSVAPWFSPGLPGDNLKSPRLLPRLARFPIPQAGLATYTRCSTASPSPTRSPPSSSTPTYTCRSTAGPSPTRSPPLPSLISSVAPRFSPGLPGDNLRRLPLLTLSRSLPHLAGLILNILSPTCDSYLSSDGRSLSHLLSASPFSHLLLSRPLVFT